MRVSSSPCASRPTAGAHDTSVAMTEHAFQPVLALTEVARGRMRSCRIGERGARGVPYPGRRVRRRQCLHPCLRPHERGLPQGHASDLSLAWGNVRRAHRRGARWASDDTSRGVSNRVVGGMVEVALLPRRARRDARRRSDGFWRPRWPRCSACIPELRLPSRRAHRSPRSERRAGQPRCALPARRCRKLDILYPVHPASSRRRNGPISRPMRITLPDEPAARRFSRLRWVPGALEGLGTRHMQWDGSAKAVQAVTLLQQIAAGQAVCGSRALRAVARG